MSFDNNPKNFPFKWQGEDFWYSRSIVCTNYVFCNFKGVWYVAAAMRSNKSKIKQLWNVPGGFLDHGETCRKAAKRETHEEIGLTLNEESLKLAFIESTPKGPRQHVVFSYYTNLGKVDYLPVITTLFDEEGETECVKWIEMNDIGRYHWLVGQKSKIENIFSKFIKPGLWQRIINKLQEPLEL